MTERPHEALAAVILRQAWDLMLKQGVPPEIGAKQMTLVGSSMLAVQSGSPAAAAHLDQCKRAVEADCWDAILQPAQGGRH